MQAMLLPTLARMHDKRSIVAVLFRLGYVDWAQRVKADVLEAAVKVPQQGAWDSMERTA